jgi:type 1 glutamine amidotransferase
MTKALFTLAASALLGVGAYGQPAEPQAAAPQAAKRIVFLAGQKDHGFPGRHEYEKDLRLLAWCLEHSPNLKGISAQVYVGKAPGVKELEGAAAIVIESSSDRDAREHHPLFPQDPSTDHHSYDAETAAYLRDVDKLMKGGTGAVVFHYATWAENWSARQYWMNWLGGLWVQGGSTNPTDQWSIALKNPDHPVLRGVKPWSYRDEIFCRFFLPEDKRRTDLLAATPSRAAIGPQVAAWAFQRDDGHRGFTVGGVDFHENMKLEDYRRFLLNGIVWAAGMEVPAGGVESSITEEQLK